MRLAPTSFAIMAALVVPALARAQYPRPGGSGMDELRPRHEKREQPSPPAVPAGVLPPGSPRQVEVLVVSYGFSPSEIRAEQGEEIVLRVRRSNDAHCKEGLAIPARQMLVQLPLDEAVPVTLKLDRADTIELRCANESTHATLVVAPR